MAQNVQFSAIKSSMSTCISANVAFIHYAFNENTVNKFLFSCRCFFMVFKSIYGEYLRVDISLLSSLIRSVLIRLLTSVPPYCSRKSFPSVVLTIKA